MNVQITWNGTDITHSVIEYSREQDICTGFGTVDMTVEFVTARDFQPWDTIRVYENGSKMGTYNIASAEEQVPGAIYVVSCQDDSKRLTDYFIDEQYTINYSSTCKYWIELFLNMAGVSYSINAAGYGSELSDNTSLGVTSAYDAVLQMLQMSGWYMYFDPDNVCQIGSLDVDGENVESFSANQILKIGYTKNDKMLRNRAVVWGAGDPATGQWIFADTSTITAWNRPGGDYRTTVYTNSAIKTFGIAYNLAYKILNEFSKTLPEGHLQVIGSHYPVTLGKRVEGSTSTLSISGMVTHILVNMSSVGLTSTFTLDQRCPRLFGYASWNDWVYVGTQGSGVYRKYIKNSTWYNYSTGITNLNIKDLSAYDGMLGCIGNTTTEDIEMDIGAKLYLRHSSLASWASYTPAGFTNSFVISGEGFETEYLTSGIVAEASSIDRYYGINGMVTAGYTIPNPSGMAELLASGMSERRHDPFPASGNLSWVTGITLGGYPVYTQQVVVISGEEYKYDYAIVDLETNWDGNNLVSTYAGKITEETVVPFSGWGIDFGDTHLGGEYYYRPGNEYNGSSNTLVNYLPEPTSGIFVEMNTEYKTNSGWWNLYQYNPSYDGTVWIDGGVPPNGAMYTCQAGEYAYIEENFFYTVSGEDGQEAALGNHWSIEAGLWNTSDRPNVCNFYKISDTEFSILYWDRYGYVCTKFITVGETASGIGTAEVTSTVEQDIGWDYFKLYNGLTGGYTSSAGISQTGGRYFSIFGACGSPGEGVASLGVCVVDMTTGGINVTDLFSPGTTDDYRVFDEVAASTNYMLYAAAYNGGCADDPCEEFIWQIHTAVVNKNTGAVTTSLTDCLLTANYTDLYQIKFSDASPSAYQYRLRPWFLLPATDSVAKGIAYIGALDDLPGFGDIGRLCNVQEITLNLATGNVGATPYDDYTEDWTGDEWVIGSPTWMHISNVSKDEDDIHQFEGIFGANKVFCKYYRTDIEDEDAYIYAVLLNPSDYDDYTVIDFPPAEYDLGINCISLCSNVQGDDGLIYMAGSWNTPYYFDDITLGYDTNGVLKKVAFLGYDGYIDHPEWGEWTTYGGTGQIFGNKYGYNDVYDIGYFSRNWSATFYEPSISITQEEHHNYEILLHNPKVEPSGQFSTIYRYNQPMHLDTAKNIPTVVYTKPYLDDYPSAIIARSFLNEWRSFDTRSPGGVGVHDVRVFDLSDPGGYFPVSGVASGFLDRFIGIAGGHAGALMLNSELENINYDVICSGNFTHLDFTNNDPDPYIFVSTSGTTTASGRFLQKNTQSYFWNDYSVGLPSGVITIIRADDRM